MKIGRNDPCPCGSGKKYKQCCLIAQVAPPVDADELTWRRLRRALEGFPVKLVDYAVERAGGEDPWEAFCQEEMVWDSLPDEVADEIFGCWAAYHWIPASRPGHRAVEPISAAAAWLAQRGKRMEPLLRDYVAATLRSPFSYYEVIATHPGRSVQLIDLIDERVVEVLDKAASQSLEAGQVLFAKLVPVHGIVMIEAMFGWTLANSELSIIDLRAELPALDPVRRAEADVTAQMLAHLAEVVTQTWRAPSPTLVNRQGEPIEFHVLHYDIDSAAACCAALADLQPDAEAVLAEASRDEAGEILSARLHWVDDGPDQTLLAVFRIEGQRLQVEVNSRERAERVKALIEKRLGGTGRLRLSDIQSTERLLQQASDPDHQQNLRASQAELAAFNAQPEVRALIEKELARHYATWPDTPLPALGGRTPLQAVADPVGREKVQALLGPLEDGPLAVPETVMKQLRERLGLG